MNTSRLRQAENPDDLRHVLRAGTSDLHARVDAHFAEGLDVPGAYARYLVGMHRFASDFEVVVGVPPRLSFWLACDLRDLALHPLPPSGVRARVDAADERLGWEYVMAGSSLGARHLLRGAQALGHTGESGARFLSGHVAGDAWRSVLERLAARSARTDLPRARLLQGARDAFLLVQSCFERSADAIPFPNEEPAA